MSNGLVKVYYIGNRRNGKRDNVLRKPHRFWREFGDSIDVPAEDAAVYMRYDTVWGDEKAYQKAREARKVEQVKAQEVSAPAQDEDDTPEMSGPEITADERETLIQAAVLQLDPKSLDDYTKGGVPRVTRVVEIIGGNVNATELDDAIKSLRAAGKLPEKG